MTPMSKFVAILLMTGDILIYELLTGITICGFSTNTKNANALWIGQQRLEEEFKQEDKYANPLGGHNELYEDISGQQAAGQ